MGPEILASAIASFKLQRTSSSQSYVPFHRLRDAHGAEGALLEHAVLGLFWVCGASCAGRLQNRIYSNRFLACAIAFLAHRRANRRGAAGILSAEILRSRS